MRTLRSSFATMSSTPSSTRLRPSFHCSTTRIEYCSISSGFVVGTISTATWLPLRVSKVASLASIAARWSGVSVLVRSVTRVLSGGTGISAATAGGRNTSAAANSARSSAIFTMDKLLPGNRILVRWARRGRRSWRGCGGLAEVDLGRLADRLLVLDRELRLLLVTQHHRREIGRELPHGHVVLLHGLDEALTRHGYAILRALALRQHAPEIGVGLDVGVVRRHHQQAGKRRRKLALRLLEPGECRRIVDQLRCGLDRADLGPRIGHAEQNLLLLAREPLLRLDEVGDQSGAALVLVHHFRP